MQNLEKDWSKASSEELIKEAKKRYPIGCWVDQKTAYIVDGKPMGKQYKILSDEVKVTKEETYDGVEYRNVTVDETGVYNTMDNKWAETIK